jgi:hypothetical protein
MFRQLHRLKLIWNELNAFAFCVRWGAHCVKGASMAAGDNYRAKALELLAHAETERDQAARAELESLAAAYLRLAEQAERNSALTIEFDLPPEQETAKRKR